MGSLVSVGSLVVNLSADTSRLKTDMASGEQAVQASSQRMVKDINDVRTGFETVTPKINDATASTNALAVAERNRAEAAVSGLSETSRLLNVARSAADDAARSLAAVKIDPEQFSGADVAIKEISTQIDRASATWQEKIAIGVGAGVGAGVVAAQTYFEKFEEFVKTKLIIAGVAIAAGVTVAAVTAVYAAYKVASATIGFIQGLFTGESYKSENIDALVKLNNEVKTLQENLQLTAVGASALNEALKLEGVDGGAYAATFKAASAAIRTNREELDRLGVAYQDQQGNLLPVEEVLKNAAAVLATYTEGWDRQQAAAAIGMGSEKEIQAALSVSSEKIQAAKGRLADYNLVVGEGSQEAVAQYEKAMREFNRESEMTSLGFKRAIADQVMPILTQLAEFFRDGFPYVVNTFRYSMATVTSLFYGLKTVVYMVAESILGSVSAIGTGLAGIATAGMRVMTGDFSGAKDALIKGWTDAKARLGQIGDNIVEQARRNAAAMRLAWGADSFGAAGQPNAKPKTGKAWTPKPEEEEEAAATAAAVSEYDRLIRAIREKIATQELDLASTSQLTEGQKIAAKFVADLRDSVLDLTDAQKLEITNALESLIALEKANEAKKEAKKAADELYKAGEQGIKSLKDQVEQQKQYNSEIGLSKDVIDILAAGKLDLAALNKEEEAQAIETAAAYAGPLRDAYIQYAEQLREQAKLLREQADLKREASVKTEAAEEAKKAADAWKKASEQIENSLTDSLMRGFEKGKSFAENLRDTVVNMFKTMILRPVVQAIIQPVVGPITNMMMSVLGGGQAAAATAGGVGSIANGAGLGMNIGSMMPWQNTGIAGTLGRGVEQFGSWLGNGTIQNFGSGMQGYTSLSSYGVQGLQAGQIAGQFVNGAAGFMIGRSLGQAISGGYAVGGGSGNSAVNAGAVIGTVLGGPIGGAIGGAIGGLVNRAFGRKLADSGIEGNVTGDEFSGRSFDFYKGGWFRSDKTKYGALDKATTNALSGAVSGMYDTFDALGEAIGAGAGMLASFTHTFKVSTKGMNEQDAQKAITAALGSTSDAMAVAFVDKFRDSITRTVETTAYMQLGWGGDSGEPWMVPYRTTTTETAAQARQSSQLDPYIDDIVRIFDARREELSGLKDSEGQLSQFTTALFGLGDSLVENAGFAEKFGEVLDFDKLEAYAVSAESVLDTFARLNTVFDATNAVVTALGADIATAFGAAGLASTEARQRLIDRAGGIDSLTSGTAFFTQNFLSEAEQMAPVIQSVTERMSELNLAWVDTRDEFKGVVTDIAESGRLATEEGANLYVQLMQIAPAFSQVADYSRRMADEAIANAQRQAEETARAQEAATRDAQEAARSSLDSAMRAVESAFAGVQRAFDAERDAVTASHEAAMQSINASVDGVNESIRRLTDLSGSLRSSVSRMRDQSLAGVDRMQAQAQIQAALAIARAGGVLPDANALSDALNVVSQPIEGLYATSEEAQRDLNVTRNTIAELADLADGQLSVEQRTLKTLEDQRDLEEAGYNATIARLDQELAFEQSKLDILGGINSGVLSIPAAIAQLGTAISAATSAQAVAAAATSSRSSVVSGLYSNILGRAPEAAGAAFWESAIASNPKPMDQLVRDFIGGALSGGTAQDKINAIAYARSHGIPGFASGTSYFGGGMALVGEEGPEIINTGPARVFTASQTAQILRGDSNTALLAEIRELRREIAQLRSTAERTEEHSRTTAVVLDRAAAGGPLLVEVA